MAPVAAPVPVFPDALPWRSPPGRTGVEAAWVVGAETAPGPYVLRVKLASGAKIPPHTHPDARTTTVLAGTLYVGFGESFDAARAIAIPEGAVYVAPAGVPHFVWARDGAVVYQETGSGPTATSFVEGKR
jgi:quercetin dioxygenase-like cupin family protein